MIPRAYITEWTQYAPWKTNEQVEQDLIICRALADIYKDDYLSKHLAFRGGTALHKLYLWPQPRYSEDIDLVQIHEGPIGEILDRLREILDPWFEEKAKFKKTQISNKLTYRFTSEFPPVQRMRLKVEINCREHFSVLGLHKIPLQVNSRWHTAQAEITTYQLEELIGTKLRALYQRSKGRDLYDLYQALTKVPELDIDQAIRCYKVYMDFSEGVSPTGEQYLDNLNIKMKDPDFLGDTIGLIRPEEALDASLAYHLIVDKIIKKL